MKDQDYHRELAVPVPATEAYKAAPLVGKWWTKNFEGSANNLNDTFTVRFGETWVTFKVTKLKQDEHLTWLVEKSYIPWLKDENEWTGTSVIWDFAENNSTTLISFTHQGLTPGVECYENCEKGWDFYFCNSFKKLLTGGEGLPDTPSSQRT